MITARLFARLREQAGTATEQLDAAGGTVADVYDALRRLHPALESDRRLIRPARNEEVAAWDDVVRDGDVVAFIPPVSGGSSPEAGAALLELVAEPLDARRTEAAVAHPGAGGICTFSGVVRDHSRGEAVTHLEYEAYGEMARREMATIAHEVAERWPEARLAMVHRTGTLQIGEPSVVVSASAPHRAEAFEACRYAIDELKERVPIWKKEFARSGASWIEGANSRRA
jgi:MoaE-MoaD fusion protein